MPRKVFITRKIPQPGIDLLINSGFQVEVFNKNSSIALTSTNIEFLKPVFPKEKVSVFSKKIYFRFGKLKCNVTMKNSKEEVVCKGEIAGIIVQK